MCQMMKSDNKAKAGLLQLLEISSREWPDVTTELVTDLPKPNGFTAIVIFVDKLTKMVHLPGCKKEVATMEYAQIFIDNVFPLHYLPEVTISELDPHFTRSSGVHCLICSIRIFG